MKTEDWLIVGAALVLGWAFYRMLDSRAQAVSLITDTPQTEPWTPPFVPTMPRITLPLLTPDPVLDTAVLTEYDVVLPF